MITFKNPRPIEFEAEIESDEGSGSAGFVEVPHNLKQTYGKGNLVPVNATFDGRVQYTVSLVNMGGDCAFLPVRTDKLTELGKRPGDRVHVGVELDTEPRRIVLADDAQLALDASAEAVERWKKISYFRQREYHHWIEDAKRSETRQRRIKKMVEMVGEGLSLRG